MNFINSLHWNSCSCMHISVHHLFSWPVHLQKTDFIRPGWLIACLNCLTNASPLFPFISFPASQISHLRPWEIQYLICEVYCLAEWKAVDATDNCYRQKDNYRSFGALSKRMTCLCWFTFKSSDVLCALLAVPFLWGLLFDAWFGVINIVPSNSKSVPVLIVDSSCS